MQAGASVFCRTDRFLVCEKTSALKRHAELEHMELMEAYAKVGFNLPALSVLNTYIPQGMDRG